MTDMNTETLAALTKRINRLQEMGVFPDCLSVSITGGKPRVFFINGGLESLPEGELVFKSRNDDYWPWEASVVKYGIEFSVWVEKDDCWALYLDFAA